MSRLSLNELRHARKTKHAELLNLPGVVGTGLGVKRRAGEIVAPSALMVFVDRKLPDSEVRKNARIPRYVRHRGRQITTDVVEINAIRPEFGSPPYFMSDFWEKGVVSAFAQANGMFHLVTCAHCLMGADRNPYTISPVGLWVGPQNGYVEVGETVYSINSPGFGDPGDFGFIDAGFARLRHREIIRRAQASSPMILATSIRVRQRLVASSPFGEIEGVVDGVELVVHGQRTDLLIQVVGAGTHKGFSGMMWRTLDGANVGIHSHGAQFSQNSGSRYSMAAVATRVAAHLQIGLLEPI